MATIRTCVEPGSAATAAGGSAGGETDARTGAPKCFSYNAVQSSMVWEHGVRDVEVKHDLLRRPSREVVGRVAMLPPMSIIRFNRNHGEHESTERPRYFVTPVVMRSDFTQIVLLKPIHPMATSNDESVTVEWAMPFHLDCIGGSGSASSSGITGVGAVATGESRPTPPVSLMPSPPVGLMRIAPGVTALQIKRARVQPGSGTVLLPSENATLNPSPFTPTPAPAPAFPPPLSPSSPFSLLPSSPLPSSPLPSLFTHSS